MEDRISNVKKIIVFFVFCFMSIITYLVYFNLFQAEKIKYDSSNPRMTIEEKTTIRGNILDKSGEKLVYTDTKTKKRIYKFNEVFGNITGYNSQTYGKTGLEKYYNNILLGNELTAINICVFLNKIKDNLLNNQKRGDNLILTIDSKLQRRIYDMFGENKGGAVCINPKTGEILAMVSKPSFNPNNIEKNFDDYSKDNINKPFINRAIQEYYPPGSVFKIVTAAAAIDNIDDIENYKNKCDGELKLGDKTVKDYQGERHGDINLKNAFKYSCNNTFAKLGIKLGYSIVKKTSEKFLFNSELYIKDDFASIPVKTAKFDFSERDDIYLATSSIGQHEVKANPMTMALMVSAIANNGEIMQPYLLDSITDYSGNVKYKNEPKLLTTAIGKDNANLIKSYMIATVNEGTAKRAKNNKVQIAAKTGTAENAEGKEPHSWFVAFAPADNPEIAVAVVVENGGAGSGRALEIAKDAILYYLNK